MHVLVLQCSIRGDGNSHPNAFQEQIQFFLVRTLGVHLLTTVENLPQIKYQRIKKITSQQLILRVFLPKVHCFTAC